MKNKQISNDILLFQEYLVDNVIYRWMGNDMLSLIRENIASLEKTIYFRVMTTVEKPYLEFGLKRYDTSASFFI